MSLDRQAVENEIAELERKAAALRQYLGEPAEAEDADPIAIPVPRSGPPKERVDLRKRIAEKKAVASASGNRPCGCGPTGRHRKTCKLAGSSVVREPQEEAMEKPYKTNNGRLLTEEEFEIVKELRAGPLPKTSMQILAELPDDVRLQQVNWAVLLKDYDAYVEHAESV